jgi:hypothetical protein
MKTLLDQAVRIPGQQSQSKIRVVGHHVERGWLPTSWVGVILELRLGDLVRGAVIWGRLAGKLREQWCAHAEASGRNSPVLPFCETGSWETVKMRCCREVWSGVVPCEWGYG